MDVSRFEEYKQILMSASRYDYDHLLLDACIDPRVSVEQYCLLWERVDKLKGMS